MNKKLLLVVLCFLFTLACSLPVALAPQAESLSAQEPSSAADQARPVDGPAQTYYVAPGGSDSNPGTRQKPWASPGYASRRLRPGDTLVILGGRYILSEYDADILTPPSGAPNAWITIQGETGSRRSLYRRSPAAQAGARTTTGRISQPPESRR